ncbi:hypothetical protein FTO70_11120 [Methanosarcina sp. KYL-1]|uniref:methylenetetrahydrofolate reductase C-terminal domain-containing protein n=1 Tax=Methanosarcina sp. KYL-1 TaxID=2602068 RepID=UPI002100DE70|nr:methylenetetrahydrofolate reductase C-terminal domain-containing protein [Methanosarcina sp. KYL-1]MCQ1536220.1 hypothetical protein [Methanosarcina sp. KYL-1]
MIITSAKPFEEILELLKNEDYIFVIGCNVCAAKLKTGGEPEVLEMCRRLEESGKHVVGWALPTAACSIRSYETLLEKNDKLDEALCVLVMGCGSGVSAVANVVDLPIYGSNNTLSLGGSSGGKLLSSQCVMCGDCTISEFGGLCPKAQCPKGLLNGPCGGAVDGKCEVDSEKDCVWSLIYERLKKIHRLDLLYTIHAPKEHAFK